MNEIAETPKQTTNELQRVKSGLESFESRKESLIILAESAKGLDVNSVEDKAAFRIVSEKRKELMRARTSLEKEGKSLRDIITPISKMVSSKEKELIAIVSTEEQRLLIREQWFESEVEKIRLQKELEEKERIQARIDALSKYNVGIDYMIILAMTDSQFEEKLKEVKESFDEIQRVEAEKINRQNRLVNLGLSFNGSAFVYEDYFLHWNDIKEMTAVEFAGTFAKVELKIQQIKEKKEAEANRLIEVAKEQEAKKIELDKIAEEQRKAQEKIDAAQKEIEDEKARVEKEKLDAIKLKRTEELKPYILFIREYNRMMNMSEEDYSKEFSDIKKGAELQWEHDRKEAQKKIDDKIKFELEEKERLEAAAKEKDAKRIARLPDKKKIIDFADKILSIEIPELKTEEAQLILRTQLSSLKDLLNSMKTLAEKL